MYAYLNMLLKQFTYNDEPPLSSKKDSFEYDTAFLIASATFCRKTLV